MSHFEENRRKRFSEALKKLYQERKKNVDPKLSQEKLAEELFVARETVSGWMNGKQFPQPDMIVKLESYFNVPPGYFSSKEERKGLTLIDEEAHSVLEEQCERFAERIGLSPAFVSFIKESPALSDLIVSLCWVNPKIQSLDPSVPEIPENVFQFVSSSGVKVYLPKDVMQMLRNVQEDLSEYLPFLLQKHRRVIDEYYSSHRGIEPASKYALIRRGMGGLSDVEAAMVDMYRLHPDLPEQRKGERIARFLRNVGKEKQRAVELAAASEEEVRNDE